MAVIGCRRRKRSITRTFGDISTCVFQFRDPSITPPDPTTDICDSLASDLDRLFAGFHSGIGSSPLDNSNSPRKMDKAKSIISKLSSKLSPSKSAAGSQSGSGKQAGEEAIEASKPDGQAQSSSGSQPGPLKSPYPPIDIPRLSVSNFLFHSSYSKPADKEAEEAPLFFNDEISLSFAECRSRALKVATGLRKRGWKKGDVMSLFAPNQVSRVPVPGIARGYMIDVEPVNGDRWTTSYLRWLLFSWESK